ncbi:MAG: glycoside hydrolase family 2 [Sediminibacterium sp.]|nr:glycoside hydrolase family 2 [Sediminibacterium sp.]
MTTIKKIPLIVIIVFCGLCTRAQHLAYKGIYAPAESWVKKTEKPYRQDLCLNGLWQFQAVALPDKFREGYDPAPALPQLKNDDWDKTLIRIPSPWNVNSFADRNGQGGDFRCYPSYPKEWENIKMGWLKKIVAVPAGWKGQRIQLHFEAAAGDALIIVNGKTVGTHFGIFLPFDVDITDAVMAGKQNEILVGIRKPSLFDRRSDYGRRTYQAGSFWGQHIAGIWQDVYLVALPVVHVSNVYVKPLVDSGKLVAELTVTNDGDLDAEVVLQAKALRWNRPTAKEALQMAPVSVMVPAHTTIKTVLSAPVNAQLEYWAPEAPNLYDLVVKVTQASKTIDSKTTRFGWRQIKLNGSKVLLNGKELVMRGDSWHFLGIPQMTRRYAEAWYKAMRDAKLNAVRLHAQPYPSFYLDVADEMGILVLDETAMWASDGGPKLDDPVYWQDSKNHLKELVMRDRNHPSVFGWSISNEIMPIVRGVMRNPPGMRDTLVKYYSEWAAICRQFDPSRQWISADGEDDGDGKLPTYIVHYGGFESMKRGEKSGKPWGVGEAGNAYYGTPEQVSETNGMRAYESFAGRMEGVGASSYQSLMAQKERNAVYQSVFNMVWYGLKPLPLGLKDITKAPTLDDGVYFTSFKEGQPGVQPERLGPYSTTLNPGYDPSLPAYQTWPLFDAIRDAAADKTIAKKWMTATKDSLTTIVPRSVSSLKLISGPDGKLAAALKRTGVLFEKTNEAEVPELIFIDGAAPPSADSRSVIDKTLMQGGTVVVWGPEAAKLNELNALLPAPLELTQRAASSLLVVQPDAVTTGISAADLYFSELRPPEIVTQGLAGLLVSQSRVLLEACNTDWLRWNKQPEYAKTAMVLRSEYEAKPSGAVLIEKKTGNGRLIVTTLPAAPRLAKAEKAVRKILANIGTPLGPGSDVGKPLRKSGDIVRALFAGSFPVNSLQDGIAQNFIDPASGESIKTGTIVKARQWQPLFEESGLIDLSRLKLEGPKTNAAAYLSFWVFSPRDLSDLLIEPNIPSVNMEVTADDAAQVWLNGKIIINTLKGSAKAEALKLRQGWNHILVKVVQTGGGWQFSGRFTSNQPDFISGLESALEKP